VIGTVLRVRPNLCRGCVVNIELLRVLTASIGKEALVDIWGLVVVVGAVFLVHEVVRSDRLNLYCDCVVNIKVVGVLTSFIGKEAVFDI